MTKFLATCVTITICTIPLTIFSSQISNLTTVSTISKKELHLNSENLEPFEIEWSHFDKQISDSTPAENSTPPAKKAKLDHINPLDAWAEQFKAFFSPLKPIKNVEFPPFPSTQDSLENLSVNLSTCRYLLAYVHPTASQRCYTNNTCDTCYFIGNIEPKSIEINATHALIICENLVDKDFVILRSVIATYFSFIHCKNIAITAQNNNVHIKAKESNITVGGHLRICDAWLKKSTLTQINAPLNSIIDFPFLWGENQSRCIIHNVNNAIYFIDDETSSIGYSGDNQNLFLVHSGNYINFEGDHYPPMWKLLTTTELPIAAITQFPYNNVLPCSQIMLKFCSSNSRPQPVPSEDKGAPHALFFYKIYQTRTKETSKREVCVAQDPESLLCNLLHGTLSTDIKNFPTLACYALHKAMRSLYIHNFASIECINTRNTSNINSTQTPLTIHYSPPTATITNNCEHFLLDCIPLTNNT